MAKQPIYIGSDAFLNEGRQILNEFAIDPAYRAEVKSETAVSDANRLGNQAISDANKLGNEAKATAKQADGQSLQAIEIAKDTNDNMNNIIGGETDSAEIIAARKPSDSEAFTTVGERLNVQLGKMSEFRNEKSLIDKMKGQFESEKLDVTWFGAVCDGITDDSDAMIRTVKFAEEVIVDRFRQGCTIFIPTGQIQITKNIRISRSGIVISGVSMGATTVIAPNCNFDIFTFWDETKSMYFSGIKNIKIFTPGNSTSGYHVTFIKNIYAIIDDVSLVGWYNGIRFDGCGKVYIHKLTGSQEERTSGKALYFMVFSGEYGINGDMHFTDVQGLQKLDRDNEYAVKIECCDGLYFTNFHIHGGLLFLPNKNNNYNTVASVYFTNAYFDGSKAANVAFSGTSDAYRNIFFNNVNARAGTYGIDVITEALLDRVFVSNFNVYDSVNGTMRTRGSDLGLFTISNMSSEDNNKGLSVDTMEYDLDGGVILLSNVSIDSKNTTGGNFKFTARTSAMIENLVLQNGAKDKRFTGVHSNIKFGKTLGTVLKEKGSAVITKGTKTVQVLHHLGRIAVSNTDILVTPRTPISDFWISDVTGNGFKINTSENVTADGIFTWLIDVT